MDPILASLLIGSAVGVGKNLLVDQPQANRQRQLEAMKARFSPWTHQDFQGVGTPSPIGGAMQGGLTGMAVGQGLKGAGVFDGAGAGTMAGAAPYAGPPAVPQPAYSAAMTTPSGFNPWQGAQVGAPSYGDYVSGQALNPRSY